MQRRYESTLAGQVQRELAEELGKQYRELNMEAVKIEAVKAEADRVCGARKGGALHAGADGTVYEKTDMDKVLEARGKQYGRFIDNAEHAQNLKNMVHNLPKWNVLEADQKEALDNICQKIARMMNGNPNHLDSWVDICGYSQLVVDRLRSGGHK